MHIFLSNGYLLCIDWYALKLKFQSVAPLTEFHVLTAYTNYDF